MSGLTPLLYQSTLGVNDAHLPTYKVITPWRNL